jgi:uncharacterized protein (TIGR03066 family)
MQKVLVLGIAALFALGLFLAPLQAADKPQDLIVGKWERKEDKVSVILEFTKDGKLKVKATGPDGQTFEISGTYKFTADDKMDVEMTFNNEKKNESLKVKVTKDELTTTDSSNKAETFKRSK